MGKKPADKPAAKTEMPRAPSEFGKNLDQIMKARNLTNAWLAEQTGISASAISRLRSGERAMPTERTVLAIASALDVDFSDLTGTPRRGAQIEPRLPADSVEEMVGETDPAELLSLYMASEFARQDKPMTAEEIRWFLSRTITWRGAPPTAKTASIMLRRHRQKLGQ